MAHLKPGMLGELMSVFGEANLNVVQQINTSKGELAYNVIDLELPRTADGKVDVGEFGTGDFDKLQAKIMEVSGVKSTRFISDWCPGTGYAVKVGDQTIGMRQRVQEVIAPWQPGHSPGPKEQPGQDPRPELLHHHIERAAQRRGDVRPSAKAARLSLIHI